MINSVNFCLEGCIFDQEKKWWLCLGQCVGREGDIRLELGYVTSSSITEV